MINLEPTISQIEKLLNENTEASVVYAALECRLAIERICYERLRLAHDYISHDDLRKWQPSDIVKTLIQEVDTKTAETFSLFIAQEPTPEGASPPTREDYEAMEWLPFGTQVGFEPNRLRKLWNGLANLALHVKIPTSKDATVKQYGDIQKIASKVRQALAEIKRISEGTMMSSGIMMGKDVSFGCNCTSQNKRRHELLQDGQIVNCINPDCDESYGYVQSDMSFGRRIIEIVCSTCKASHDIPKGTIEKLKKDQHIPFNCEGCGEIIYVSWHLVQAQQTKPPAEA
jgi:hypothetical protein